MTPSTDGAFCLRAAAEDGVAPVLQGVQARARLDGTLFGLTLRQTYRNTSTRTLEVVYTFPLPASAVLLGFAAEFDSHRVECRVLPRAQAEDVYETALADGDAPALLEAGPEGLHTANIGNLLPGEQVVLEIRYAQLVALEQGRLRLAVPTTIAPRYGDAQRSGLHAHQVPEAALDADYPLEFSVLVAGALARAAVECPTHEVRAAAQAAGLCLELAPGARLDRDVVLIVTPAAEPSGPPAGVLSWSAGVGVAAFEVPVVPASEDTPLALKLLVDCSGSMSGDSIASARRALQGVAAGLRQADEVSLTRFGTEVVPVLSPTRCTPQARAALGRAIEQTDADLGGTEMEKALQGTFALPSYLAAGSGEASGRADVLLITDGEVWDTRSMIERARRSGHRVFVIGVGTSPAEPMLRHLAEATGGACEFATPGEQLEAAAARMLHRMRQPVWTGLHVHWEGCGSPDWELPLPAGVFGGDTLLALAGFEGLPQAAGAVDLLGDPIASARPARVRLLARADGGQEQELGCIEAVTEVPGDDLPRIAAARRIAAWEAADRLQASQHRQAGMRQASLDGPEDAAQNRALELAVLHRLVTAHTHAVLVHERAEADKPADDSVLHRVKSMLAAGWGGTGSVRAAGADLMMRVDRSGAGSRMKFGTNGASANWALTAAKLRGSAPPAAMSLMAHDATPSVWRSARRQVEALSPLATGHDDIEFPAFLRPQPADDRAPARDAGIMFSADRTAPEQLIVAVAALLDAGGDMSEVPVLVHALPHEPHTLRAIAAAQTVVADEAACWVLLALWLLKGPAGQGLQDFEPALTASVTQAAITPGHIGRVWTIFEREMGPAGAPSRRQERLRAALSGSVQREGA